MTIAHRRPSRPCRLLAALALTASVAAPAPAAPPEIPATPAPILDLVSARPFVLDEGYVHHWRAEKPTVTSGWMLVLKVDPALVYPRQTEEPVLYVGRQTAQRVNVGYRSGHVVAIVPAVIDDPHHPDFIDLRTAPIWFGTPRMPERVNAETIRAERRAADAAGIRPGPRERIDRARDLGGTPLRTASKGSLVREAARLVQRHSPQEKDLVDGILLPERSGGKRDR